MSRLTLSERIVIEYGSITFTDLEGLDIIRYAPGTYDSSNAIKSAPNNKYIKGSAVSNDTVTFTGLNGTYSFLVQYVENSKNIFTVDFGK